jgi:PAS domain S-box-containing protein
MSHKYAYIPVNSPLLHTKLVCNITKTSEEPMDYTLFEATPGINVLIKPNASKFAIVAVSKDLLHTFKVKKEKLVGRDYFDIFKCPGEDPTTTDRLRTSFENVLVYKRPDQLDGPGPEPEDSDQTLRQRSWRIVNVPVTDADRPVEFIIQSHIDITNQQLQGQQAIITKDLETAYDIFLNAPVIIGILQGDDYKIILANNGLLEVWGRTAEVIGQPLLEAIPELAEQGFISLLDKVRETGEAFYAYEYPIVLTRNGKDEVLYFDFVYKPLYDGDNTVANGIISVGHDVTPQVISRRKEQTSEAQYRHLSESIQQGFCVIEMIFDEQDIPVDYRFIEVNSVFESQTGLTDVVGKTIRSIVPDHEAHWFEIYGKVATTREGIRFVEESVALEKWFDVYAFPIDEPEKKKVAVLFSDITEARKAELTIRESEERFRNLADDSPIFVFIIDVAPEAHVSYWNKTWLDYTGQSFEEAKGRAWDGIIHPDDLAIVMEHYAPAFQYKKSYFLPAVRVKRHDGEYRWHAFKGNPRYTASGEFNGYVGVGFDIHNQKLNEDAIKRSEASLQMKVAERTSALERTVDELKHSNQNLQAFAYAASHDLKEPMRKIKIFSERLRQKLHNKMTPEEDRYFGRISHSTQRMITLIDDLLSYSYVTNGIDNKELINLNQKVNLVLEDLELEIEDKKASIIVGPLPNIMGQERQVQQLFQNLITNAIKYSKPEEAPRIEITSKMVEAGETLPGTTLINPGSYYLIEVKDNGLGFDQEDADRIFNVFTRLHNSQHDGTGIGLAIARKVVESHSGFIWAESKAGKGACFKVLLPAGNAMIDSD